MATTSTAGLTNTTGTAASSLPAAGGSSSSTLSDWAGQYVTDMLGKTQAIANTPYQTYQGPMTAGESGLQSKVFQGLGGLSFPSNLGQSFSSTGAYTPPTYDASGAPIGGAGAGGTGIAAQYMNPYLQSVLNPQLDELRRQSQITQMGNAGKATQAGAFGGGRQAIMDAETQRNLMQEQNKTVGQGYANAYDKALGQFNTEQGQSKTLADMLAQQGQTQRGIEQEGVTADLNEFNAQRDYPQKQLQFEQSMLQGLPLSTVTNTPAAQSGIGQLTSTIGGMSNLMDALNRFGLGTSSTAATAPPG
jgi:hypothetical protein